MPDALLRDAKPKRSGALAPTSSGSGGYAASCLKRENPSFHSPNPLCELI